MKVRVGKIPKSHLDGPADQWIDDHARGMMVSEIGAVGGREVFFVGKVFGGIVKAVEPHCSGTEHTVCAPIQKAFPGDVIIHNHPSGDVKPSEADMKVSADAALRGIGSFIVNNDVTVARVIVSPFTERELRDPGFVWARCWDAMRKAVTDECPVRDLIDQFDPRLAVAATARWDKR